MRAGAIRDGVIFVATGAGYVDLAVQAVRSVVAMNGQAGTVPPRPGSL